MLARIVMRSVLMVLLLLARAACEQSAAGRSNLVLDQAATLADVFKAACIPDRMMTRSALDLQAPITSYAVLNTSMEFVIAYYEGVARSDVPRPALHLVRYERRSQRWYQNDLFKDAQSAVFQTLCMGPAVSVHRAGLFILVGTDINPSAQCLQVLDSELKLKDTRYGWFIASVGNKIVYEHNTVHLAPTHPLVLSLYDPATAADTAIYPLPSDHEREQFIDQLRHLVAFERCEGPNCSVLPEQFESTVTEAVSNDRTGSFAFIAEFSPVGYVRDVSQSELDAKVLYVYRFARSGVEHREFPVSEMKSRFGTEQVNELLTLSMLVRVFGD